MQKNEQNKIKHSAMCCIYCGKSYKTRSNLEKHLILCEITHKSKSVKKSTHDDNDDIAEFQEQQEQMSSKKLYQIVMQLALKCNRLESKVTDLSKYVNKKIQKIDLIDYLNNRTRRTNNPKLLFENITEIIKVEQSDIEFLFHNSFLETVNLILSRSIYRDNNQNQENEIPIAAFKEKPSTIYVYTKEQSQQQQQQSQNPTWSIVTREKFTRFLNILQFKISKAFSEWRKHNAQTLIENDNHCILYDKTFSKLMEPDFKIEKNFIKFYNAIYKGIFIKVE